jgi:ABC-type polysaccharide/polyol phosphate transport system ATPase subunit
VFLNAMLLGMGRDEVWKKYKEIADFADIGDFINAPMYTYSSGMKLRLGFSIAIAADPDILILDEGIMVGDDDFQRKSSKKIDEFFRQKKTIIIVSHWMDYLKEHCEKMALLESGRLVMFGKAEEVISYYMKG